ncbi:MAG: ABC transporter permease [Oscillospiraceae bacterium]|jgi:ribose transport system permease protein/putative xylitol transport system permease protein|nr:ABC transporter permease [Oscillospiraceae bacterium]
MSVRRFFGGAWGQRIVILALIFAVMAVAEPKFFTGSNASSVLFAISIYGMMACGMLFVVLLGGLDLSVGSMAAVSACIVAQITMKSGYSGAGLLTGIVAAIAASIAVGVLHGLCVTYMRMPSFIVTLSTKYILYGVAPIITGGSFIYYPQEMDSNSAVNFIYSLGNKRIANVPMPVIFFAAVVVIAGFTLASTTYGRRLYALGGNPTASALVGVRVRRDTVAAYVVSSLLAALSGIVLSSVNMQAGQTLAQGYEGSVLMAMIVGGINLAGGEGTISGAVFGALFAGLINNMMTLLSVPSDFQKAVQGAIILVAVCINAYSGRRAGRVKLPAAPAEK